ncbi:MAG: 50S ribosomal protein L4 [Mariprofundaceae bacterium]|nr:50S ribosomal protein L4 [Mariprofundaceae bacterium]
MPEVSVVDQNNKPVGKQKLNDAVFGLEADVGFVHRVYAALAAGQRSGTHSTKTRAEVSGGGKKPWKQKGTGRARQGSTRSVQWRHGGVAHGPRPRSYVTRINRNERRRALCLALSGCVQNGRVTVLDKLELKQVKTKDFVQVMQNLEISNGLLVLAEENREVMLSGRNVKHAKVVLDGQVNLHDLLKYDHLVLTKAAIEKLEGRLA